jgi:glycosyltransferase involved in cell wall biosynthesis
MIAGKRISAFVMTFNEERNIRDCLESMKWADEIVVVDSHSTDATIDIAREYTEKIIERPFAGYVAQTAFAYEQTTGDWTLWLDADERFTPEALAQVTAELEAGADCDAFAFRRKNWFMGRWILHSGWYPEYRMRFLRRSACRIVGPRPPHPVAEVDGKTKRLRGNILHYSYPGGIMDMARRQALYAERAAHARIEQGRHARLHNLLIRPPFSMFRHYILQGGFRDGLAGLAIAVSAGWYRFLREVRMVELDNEK